MKLCFEVSSFEYFFLNILQIALKFPSAFWRNKIGDADYFGHVPGTSEDRGMFSVFYDVSREVRKLFFSEKLFMQTLVSDMMHSVWSISGTN